MTRSRSGHCLFELAARLEIEVMDGNFTPYEAYNCDEAFLARTSPTILPVQSLNGVRPAEEVPGPITRQLMQAWSDLVGQDFVVQGLNHLPSGERECLLKEWRSEKADA